MAQRLLILSCSQCKNPAPDVMPALERYDGPAFRVARKFFRHTPNQIVDLDIYVLSAEFGLIPSSLAIPHYNRRLTPQRADELREQIQTATQHLTQAAYTTCFIYAGKSYLNALISFQQLAPATERARQEIRLKPQPHECSFLPAHAVRSQQRCDRRKPPQPGCRDLRSPAFLRVHVESDSEPWSKAVARASRYRHPRES